MYNISQGIFLANKNQAKQRQLSVGHSEKVRERFRYMFPSRYANYTKENFILTCLWINYAKSPSSFDRFLDILKDLEFNTTVLHFKDSIINYRFHLSNDIGLLKSTYGKPSIQQIFYEYDNKKIQFYTLWFYLKYMDNEFTPSNIQQLQLNKIKILLLYLTFSEQSLEHIKSLFSESSILSL
jgi:hypothetical protein